MIWWVLAGGLGLVWLTGLAAAYWWRERRNDRLWAGICEQAAPHCRLLTMADGRTEWIYTQPKEEQR